MSNAITWRLVTITRCRSAGHRADPWTADHSHPVPGPQPGSRSPPPLSASLAAWLITRLVSAQPRRPRMPANSRIVANEFIRLSAKHNRPPTPMKLMKLVYIGHGFSLGLDGLPLIREGVRAWRYGPVIPDLYQKVKVYGANPITQPLRGSIFGSDRGSLTERECDIIRQTYDQYGHLNGIELSELTHRAGTPWSLTWQEGGQGTVISPDLIAEYYRKLTNERPGA